MEVLLYLLIFGINIIVIIYVLSVIPNKIENVRRQNIQILNMMKMSLDIQSSNNHPQNNQK